MDFFSTIKLFRFLFIIGLAAVQFNCTAQDIYSNISIKGSKITVPFILHDNRIFVKTIINKKAFHFIVDTGGGIVLDKTIADSLHLPLTRQGNIAGAGEKPVPLFRTLVDSIAIGDLLILNKDAMVISLVEIKNALQLDFLDGIVGYEVFQQFITGINFAESVLSFCKKEAFNVPDDSHVIPFRLLNNRIPVIKMNVDGMQAEFMIDTGDRSNLTLFSKFADEGKFRKNYALSDTIVTGYGIGGPIHAQLLTIRKAKLNNKLAVSDITARIPTIGSGAFNRTDSIKGSVGNGLLKNFTKITFDYYGKKLYIENARNKKSPG